MQFDLKNQKKKKKQWLPSGYYCGGNVSKSTELKRYCSTGDNTTNDPFVKGRLSGKHYVHVRYKNSEKLV